MSELRNKKRTDYSNNTRECNCNMAISMTVLSRMIANERQQDRERHFVPAVFQIFRTFVYCFLFYRICISIKHAANKTSTGQFSEKIRLTLSSMANFPFFLFFFPKSDVTVSDDDKGRPRISHQPKIKTEKTDQSEDCGHEMSTTTTNTITVQKATVTLYDTTMAGAALRRSHRYIYIYIYICLRYNPNKN